MAGQLTEAYGKGCGEKQLRKCMQFAAFFSDESIVYAVCIQLSWTHLRLISYKDISSKRVFYMEICIHEVWRVRTFGERIQLDFNFVGFRPGRAIPSEEVSIVLP
ncbi:DUF1016 family protein [Arundinibacter roseus]|uniref:DUF1016 family protein n=1 Tax=Arundinibacter roseus TaxID=2070510 RepID=A0A4R4JXI6_9BACT|nr:DUF1016 family protein [Arundinibacter roseus]